MFSLIHDKSIILKVSVFELALFHYRLNEMSTRIYTCVRYHPGFLTLLPWFLADCKIINFLYAYLYFKRITTSVVAVEDYLYIKSDYGCTVSLSTEELWSVWHYQHHALPLCQRMLVRYRSVWKWFETQPHKVLAKKYAVSRIWTCAGRPHWISSPTP